MDLRALLAGLTSAAVPQVPEVTGVCCDSQRIRPGDVFVAIPGFREDGRCHIAEAKARGAVCVLSREPVQELRRCRRPRVFICIPMVCPSPSLSQINRLCQILTVCAKAVAAAEASR